MQRRSEKEDAPRCCQGKHLEEDLPRQPDLAAPACPPAPCLSFPPWAVPATPVHFPAFLQEKSQRDVRNPSCPPTGGDV